MMLQCSQVHGLRDRCGGKDVAEAGVPGMRVRVAMLYVYCLMASSAIAEELGPEQAKAFVVGKLFAYSLCAHLYGLPIEPCFTVQRIDQHSFRGSIAGSGYAYCDFYQRNSHTQLERPLLMNGLH